MIEKSLFVQLALPRIAVKISSFLSHRIVNALAYRKKQQSRHPPEVVEISETYEEWYTDQPPAETSPPHLRSQQGYQPLPGYNTQSTGPLQRLPESTTRP